MERPWRPALRDLTDKATAGARNALERYSGLIANEDAIRGTWGSFKAWILEKLEPSRPISLAADRLHEEANRLDRLDGYTQRDQITAQKRAVLGAIDALERAILENGRLTPGAAFLL